jgi:hypothetical protein
MPRLNRHKSGRKDRPANCVLFEQRKESESRCRTLSQLQTESEIAENEFGVGGFDRENRKKFPFRVKEIELFTCVSLPGLWMRIITGLGFYAESFRNCFRITYFP